MTVEGTQLELTRAEFDFMSLLVDAHGKAVTREAIILSMWGAAVSDGDLALRALVCRFRQRLGPGRNRVVTVRGVGYAWR